MSDTILPPMPEKPLGSVCKIAAASKFYITDEILKDSYYDCSGLIMSATLKKGDHLALNASGNYYGGDNLTFTHTITYGDSLDESFEE